MKRVLVSLLFFVCTSTFAQVELHPLHVKQILPSENVAIAAGDDIAKIEVGNILLATFPDGTQCSMPVKSKNESYLTLSLKDCPKKHDLKIQQSLEISLYQNSDGSAKESASKTADSLNETDQQLILSSNRIESISNFTPESVFDVSARTTIVNSKTKIGSLVNSNSNANDIGGILQYGVNGWVNIGLQGSYLVSKTTESDGNNSTSSKGIKDPSLLIAFQPVKQGDGRPFNLKVDVSYSPKVVAEEHDNAGKGYSSTRTTATLARFLKSVEIGLLFSYSYNSTGEGKFEDGTKWETISYDGYMLGAYGQLQASEFIYIYGGVGFGRDSEQQQKWSKVSTGDWLVQINSYDYTLVKAGAKFVMVPEVSFISIDIESQKVHNGSGWVRNNATTLTGNIDKLEATGFTLNWTYRL